VTIRNLGSVWETIAATVPDDLALAHGETRRTWGEFERRSAALAGAFAEAGVGPDAKVAHFLYNCPEYLETTFAAFKHRAAPVNVNYRYLEDELAYLLTNSDAEVVVFHHDLASRVAAVRERCPKLRLCLQVGGTPGEGVTAFEDAIANATPAPPVERSNEDLWFLYTGGTTGMPKGVMWPHESILGALTANLRAAGLEQPQTRDDVVAMVHKLRRDDAVGRLLPAAPLMHGTSGLTSLFTLTMSGAVVTVPNRSLDANELLAAVSRERVRTMTIVGDIFARPIADALEANGDAADPVDVSSLRAMVSSGVMWSAEVKSRLIDLKPDLVLMDSLGSSEGVGFGASTSSKGAGAPTAKFTLGPNCRVFNDSGQAVEPGSGEVGVLAVGGPIPLGYYKDPAKSAETFPVIDGQRWSMPGDYATVDADGTITLLGRGSVSINSGGEKIFPEEVEEAVKTHAQVIDCNVVGLPDDRWGQRVVAVVALAPGASVTEAALVEHAKNAIAPYKCPKQIVFVDAIVRGPNAKADYRWATSVADGAARR
jgi:fatty-acyl-CoA synthase